MIASGPARVAETGPGRPLSESKEILEYDKILNIRDQIFSGNHPRLKVPLHVIRNFTPRSVQSPSLPTTPSGQAETISTAQKDNQLPVSVQESPSSNQSAVAATTVIGAGAPSTSLASTAATAKPLSGIDPIFLTKSDDLIRAEIQLQRQRIERALRDQVEQRRIDAKTKPLPQELKSDFDVADVFAKALELVKPTPEIDTEGANGNIAASDSFDENSFYSSKAPDSPQNEPVATPPLDDRQPQHALVGDATADTDVVQRNDEAESLNNNGIRPWVALDSQTSSFESAEKNRPARSADTTPVQVVIPTGPRGREEQSFEEPEYSPPGPNIVESRRESAAHSQFSERANGAPAYPRYFPFDQEPQRHQYAAQDVTVVRNHITSPVAPQPSRVSPLAVPKLPGVQARQSRRQRKNERKQATQPSARGSPDIPPQPIMSRKRRRDQEFKDNARAMGERRAMISPDVPYIKPEPVSPPPFIEMASPTYPRSRVTQGGHTYIELDSPQYTPVADRREGSGRGGYYEERQPRAYEVESASEVNIPRSASRLTYKRPVREERDLRRVATVQHARQSEYIHEYPEPMADVSPRYVRAASYAVADRPLQVEKPRYYDEQPPFSKPYVTNIHPSSPRIREEYIDPNPDSRNMGPPTQRRIVIDAEGNRYYESLAPSSRMAPPSTRLAASDPYEDSPIRAASVRAVSVLENPYPERTYAKEMPPPPVTYRRIPEYGQVAQTEHAIYDRDIHDRARLPRGASVQVIDYQHRQPTYVDEPAYPREELVRMSSVRPPPARFEDSGEPPIRMSSVRPIRREMSVYVDEDPRQTREYAPVDRISYPVTRQPREERYYGDDEALKMDLDNGQGVVRRVSRRY